MNMQEFETHKNYLSDTSISYEEKKANYETMANSLMTWKDQNKAKNVWGMVTSALAYADILTDGQRMAIDALYQLNLAGYHSGLNVLNAFSADLRRSEIAFDGHVLAKFEPHEIVLARELCHKFLSETEGTRLEYMIYNIAEVIASAQSVENSDMSYVNAKAYEVYTKYILSDLVPDDDKGRLLKYAREVFYFE